MLLLALSVGAKILLGHYVKQKGEKANSDSLVASGVDAMMDSVISLSTLVAAGIYLVGYQSGGLAGGYHFSVYHQIRGGHAG